MPDTPIASESAGMASESHIPTTPDHRYMSQYGDGVNQARGDYLGGGVPEWDGFPMIWSLGRTEGWQAGYREEWRRLNA